MSTAAAPEGSDALAALEARLDRLESKLDRIVDLMDQAMPHVAIGVDVADEAIAAAQARGVDVDARMHRALELVEQLTDPAVMDVLSKLAENAPTMGPLVDMAGATMPHIAMGVDIADETIAAAQARGVDVDARARQAAGLVEQLTDPAVLDVLSRLADNAPAMAPLVDMAGATMPHIAMGVDIADETIAAAQARGVDVDERLRRVGGLVEKLSDPAVLDALESTLEHADALAEGATMAAGAPGLTAVAIEVMDEELRRLQDQGVDIDAAQRNGIELLVHLTRLMGSPEARALIDSGLLEPHNAHRITQLSSAVVDTLNEEPALIGPWGSFVRTWDKRFQRFAGFSFALAWRVGALLGPDKGRNGALHRR